MHPEVRDRVMVGIGGGRTIEQLAEEAGVAVRTFKGWLAKGRREPDGEYGSLARAFDGRAAPVVAIGTGAMTDDEYELHLAAAIRRRDVRALKIYEDRKVRRDGSSDSQPADPLDGLDELARRRAVGT